MPKYKDLNQYDQLRLSAKTTYSSKKIMLVWLVFIGWTFFTTGLALVLEADSFLKKIFVFLIVAPFLFLPFLIFLIFILSHQKYSKKIEKALQTILHSIPGKIFDKKDAQLMVWLEWFEQHWKAPLPSDFFSYLNNLKQWAFETTYKGIPLLLLIRQSYTRTTLYFFTPIVIEKNVNDLFCLPSLSKLVEAGVLPEIKDQQPFFHYETASKNINEEQFSKLFRESFENIQALKEISKNQLSSNKFPSQMKNALNIVLGKAGYFTFEELQNNQQGKLSSRQKLKLIFKGLIGVLIASAAFLWAWYLQIGDITTKSGQPITSHDRYWGTIIFSGIGIIAFLFFIVKLWQTMRGQVMIKSGIINKTVNYGSKGTVSYIATIDNMRFTLSSKYYKNIISGLSYKVYYVKGTHDIMSIELV